MALLPFDMALGRRQSMLLQPPGSGRLGHAAMRRCQQRRPYDSLLRGMGTNGHSGKHLWLAACTAWRGGYKRGEGYESLGG